VFLVVIGDVGDDRGVQGEVGGIVGACYTRRRRSVPDEVDLRAVTEDRLIEFACLCDRDLFLG
jgi:hypothetical protein